MQGSVELSNLRVLASLICDSVEVLELPVELAFLLTHLTYPKLRSHKSSPRNMVACSGHYPVNHSPVQQDMGASAHHVTTVSFPTESCRLQIFKYNFYSSFPQTHVLLLPRTMSLFRRPFPGPSEWVIRAGSFCRIRVLRPTESNGPAMSLPPRTVNIF